MSKIVQEKTLTKKGYRVALNSIDKNKLKEILAELTVAPSDGIEVDTENEYPVYRKTKNYLYMPRFYAQKHFGKAEKKVGISGKKVDMKFTKTLRDYQQPIADKCIKSLKKVGGGILSVYCGFGKTVLAIYLACVLKVKTLVIVHKTFLQDQWIGAIEKFTDAKVGSIRQNKVDVEGKDIVIGMLQSISQREYDDEVFKDFGMVIVDECHHIAARVFCKGLQKACSRYMFGLSATPNRKDGLVRVLYWFLGDIIHSEKRKPNNKVCTRIFNYTSDDSKFTEKKRWIKGQIRPDTMKMTSNIWQIKGRNVAIMKILNQLRKIPKRKVLILSHRIDHLKILKGATDSLIEKDIDANKLEKGEYTTSYYIGALKKQARIDAEEADMIFGSVHMAEEGLDIPTLNTIVLVTPKKDIEQAIGRILRKSVKDMEVVPLIIDISDQLSTFQGWGRKRKTYFKKNKYNVKEYYMHNSYLISKMDYESAKFGKELSEFADTDPTVPDLQDIFDISVDDLDEAKVEYLHKFSFKEKKPDMETCWF